jgi:nucleotide-binding universal stress UspA family protein
MTVEQEDDAMTSPVVVGIDDIEHSAQAIAAGAREAELRQAPLWLGHAYHWLAPVTPGLMPGGDTPEGAVRDAATELLARAVTQVHAWHPDLDVHTYAMGGQPGPNLAELAKDAALLAVGSRGRGGFAGMLLGSVALSAVTHARCPVLVVRGATEPAGVAGRILVGVDVLAPTTGADVLAFAFEEAALRGYGVRALHAWQDPSYLYSIALGSLPPSQLGELNSEHRRRLDWLVAPWREKHPEVFVETQVLTGVPSRLLVDSSRLADLVVLGARRLPDGDGVRLGGLAHAVLHHAHCPVVIVPEP